MAHRTRSKHSSQLTATIDPAGEAQAVPLIEQKASPEAIRRRSAGNEGIGVSEARHRAWLRQAVRRDK
jgi:hypothetical protein